MRAQNTLTALPPQASHPTARFRDIDPSASGALIRLTGIDDALLDIGREAVEGVLDVDVALGGDLHEGDTQLVGQLLALFAGHHALVLPVALVADEDLVDALGGVLLDVGEPGADICEKREKGGEERVSNGSLSQGFPCVISASWRKKHTGEMQRQGRQVQRRTYC